MLLYSEKIQSFTTAHPCENVTVDGAQFRYILSGKTDGKTLVFLNGGMNTLGMWMDYVDGLSDVCRVLLFDYPQELRTNQELVVGRHFVQDISVVGYRNYSTAKALQIIFQNRQRSNIQVIGRFIQKKHIRRSHQNFQQIQPLSLAAGKLFNMVPLQFRRKEKSFQHSCRSNCAIRRLNAFCGLLDIIDHSL